MGRTDVTGPASERGALQCLVWLALGTALVGAAMFTWPEVMTLGGFGHGSVWFRDADAVLRAIAAYRHGIEPDVTGSMHPIHNYSHWWFALAPLGLSGFDTWWVGLATGAVSTIAVWFVVRPRRLAEVAWTLAVYASAPILLGLNRANVDLLIFALLSLCVPAILSPHRLVRLAAAPALLALATGLKYYPLFGLLVLTGVQPAPDRRRAVAGGMLLLAATLWDVAPDLWRYTTDFSATDFYTFGATARLVDGGHPPPWLILLSAGVLLGAGLGVGRLAGLRDWAGTAARSREALYFVLGAALLGGCFLLTVNYAYRLFFAFWLLPFLLRLAPDAPRAVRTLRHATLGLLLAVLWVEEPVVALLNLETRPEAVVRHWSGLGGTAMNGLHWLFFSCLAAWALHLVHRWLAEPAPARG